MLHLRRMSGEGASEEGSESDGLPELTGGLKLDSGSESGASEFSEGWREEEEEDEEEEEEDEEEDEDEEEEDGVIEDEKAGGPGASGDYNPAVMSEAYLSAHYRRMAARADAMEREAAASGAGGRGAVFGVPGAGPSEGAQHDDDDEEGRPVFGIPGPFDQPELPQPSMPRGPRRPPRRPVPFGELDAESLEGGFLEILARMRANDAQVKAVDFFGWGLGPDEAVHLGQALRRNTTVVKLDLVQTRIGAEGAAEVAAALEHNSTLRELDVGYSGIGDDGALAFAEAIARPECGLTGLYLMGNGIGDVGASAVAAGLLENTSLTRISLSDNVIGDKGGLAMASVLKGAKQNDTLRNAFIGRNNCTMPAIYQFPGRLTSYGREDAPYKAGFHEVDETRQRNGPKPPGHRRAKTQRRADKRANKGA